MVAKLNPIIISMYKLGAGINFVFERYVVCYVFGQKKS